MSCSLQMTVDPEVLRQASEARADAGEYFDQVLANLREQMYLNGLNEIQLPNATMGFEQVIGGINWRGEAALYNGFLSNLDTIHRTGVAELRIEVISS
jgi:hypothetical protein